MEGRIKLTDSDKEQIRFLWEEGESIRGLARSYKVDRRLIQFTLFPERQERNLELREERGGSMLYYDRDRHRDIMRNHRGYKQQLYIAGKIKI